MIEARIPTPPWLAVVIPAYDEEVRIGRTLEEVCKSLEGRPHTWEVVVVDDGSTDRTAEIITRYSRETPRVRPVSYPDNRGKGHALRVGVAETNAEWVLLCDADLSTPIHEVEKLFDARAPVAIGSRALGESRLEIRQPRGREMLGRGFNLAVQFLAVPGIRDTQCGFKLFRGDVARELFARSTLDGFGYDFEILMIARKRGYAIAEVPVRWAHREGSKVAVWSDGIRMVRNLVELRLDGNDR